MAKENTTYTPLEIQKKLWGPFCGKITAENEYGLPNSRLAKLVDQAGRNRVYGGLTLASPDALDQFGAVFGEFAPRVVTFSDPRSPQTLLPEQIAVAGGWCAIRSKDLEGMDPDCAGIMNPKTSKLEPIVSVAQVANWITTSVSFDQIVDSVGSLQAFEYAVISERRLWSELVNTKLAQVFKRRLSPSETDQINSAINQAEQTRIALTTRYIRYVTGNEKLIFQPVFDDEIWKELKEARDEMLRYAGLRNGTSDLKRMYPRESTLLDTSAMVWAMYTQPYFDKLRSRGYITKPTVLIAEPTMHSLAETDAKGEVVRRINQQWGAGIYFDPKGMNPNTGFVAYMESIAPNGLYARRELLAGQVPNISNYQELFKDDNMLDPLKNAQIDPRVNMLFLWGVNLLPFGKNREYLLKIADIQTLFQKEKERINAQFPVNIIPSDPEFKTRITSRKQASQEAKTCYQKMVADLNEKVATELKALFEYLIS